MKRIFCVLLLISMLLTITFFSSACSSKNENSLKDPATNNRTVVSLVLNTVTNPLYVSIEKGARLAEVALDIDLIVKTGTKETSVAQQISIIENMINKKVDAIVITPVGSEIIPILKKAQENGICIVTLENRLNESLMKEKGLTNIPFVGIDDYKATFELVKDAKKELLSNNKNKIYSAILGGIEFTENSNNRVRGAKDALYESPKIEIVSISYGNWEIEEGYLKTEDIFKKNPYVKFVFSANDMMVLGVLKYLETYSIKNVTVVSFNGIDEVKSLVNNGQLYSTVDVNAEKQGFEGVRKAVSMIKDCKNTSDQLVDYSFTKKLIIDENND